MSAPFIRQHFRSVSLFLICIVLVGIVGSVWAERQQASVRLPDDGVRPLAGPLNLVVNTPGDAGDVNIGDGICDTDAASAAVLCTLRAAIQEANAAATGTDSISFSLPPGSTITLNTALPDFSGNLALNGPGANSLTVMRSTAGGTPDFRIFTIPQFATVSISGLTISNGRQSSNQSGGGVSNRGTLTMNDCNVYGNNLVSQGFSTTGAGLFNAGSMTLNNCNIGGTAPGQGNGTAGEGGGISEFGTMVMTGGSIVGNSGGDGISVVNSLGGTTLINVNISNNTLFGGSAVKAGGAVTLIGCLISGNSGTHFGGTAIDVEGSNTLVVNTTISGNANGQGGGGIRQANSGVTRLVNVTVTNNRSDSDNNGAERGGGIDNQSGTMTLTNTIVAGNFRGSGPTAAADDINGGIDVSGSFNLIGAGGAGGLTNGVNNNQVGVGDPKLGPLSDNGGLTLTHRLLSGSPAIDAGGNANAGNAGLMADQRGFARVVDGPDADFTATVDIGAYELQLPFEEIGDTSTNEDAPIIIAFELNDPGSITSIAASSSNPTLIPNSPANISTALASSTGSVTLIPAANLFGTSDITVTLNRSGGSDARTFKLTVNSANDAPSFVKGADQTVLEDSGSQTISNWATAISPGPTDESGQTVGFILGNNNNVLFSTQPALTANGTLSYTPAANAAGVAVVSVSLKDDGGTANGGQDTSPVQTFAINLTQVNDAPSFTKGPDQTVNNDAALVIINNWATNVSPGPPNESGGAQGFFFVVTSNSNPGLFSTAPSVSASGTLVYRPATNAAGTAAITIVLQDSGGTANGGVDKSPPQTFNITVVPVGGLLRISSSSLDTTEASGFITVTVQRSGDLSRPVAVNYATAGDNGLPCSTANGVATPKCDFTTALGALSFAAGEDQKTFAILLAQDAFVEGPETFTVSLSNPTGGAALSTPSSATVTIADDVVEPPTNMIDDVRNFVRQHYHDFLNREPDTSGWDFWTNQITSCGNDGQCNEVRRIDVSASFFLSIEFQQSGYLVERFYKTAYGDATGTSTFGSNHQLAIPVVRFNEFLKDTQRISQGVIVLQPGWEQALESNKQAYALEFVQTSRFTASNAFPVTLTTPQFVDKLNQNAGNVLSPNERTAVINLFGGAANSSNVAARAQAIRQVAEDIDLYNAEYNRAFVLAQYFGYLRRNPNDAPDADYTGYDFWLTKLNQFNGNYINAEMVKAFLSSIEYRQRFGP